jgi:hypothetical protein
VKSSTEFFFDLDALIVLESNWITFGFRDYKFADYSGLLTSVAIKKTC